MHVTLAAVSAVLLVREIRTVDDAVAYPGGQRVRLEILYAAWNFSTVGPEFVKFFKQNNSRVRGE